MASGYDFVIKQGETLEKTFYWYSGALVTKPITAITLAYPPVFTAATHGLPTLEIPARLVSIVGPEELNTPDDEYVYLLKVDTNTFKAPELNASGLSAYVSGGYLAYTPPKDLTGYTARMTIRRATSSTTPLAVLTSVAGDIVLTALEGAVTVTMDAADTALLDFVTAVYDLELVLPGTPDYVKRLASGAITLSRETTY